MRVLLIAAALLAVVGTVSACNKTCISAETFTTNTNTALWEGPASGKLDFCGQLLDWTFCPQKIVYDNTTYEVAALDNFAKAYYEDALAEHVANCNGDRAFSTCNQCPEYLKTYACVLAFQPCAENTHTFTPACYGVCSRVVQYCVVNFGDCSAESSPFLIDPRDAPSETCSSASSIFSATTGLLALAVGAVAAARGF